MAMNKKEAEYVARLERDLKISRAFKFTDLIEPDVRHSGDLGVIIKGWVYNTFNHKVRPAMTKANSHYEGSHEYVEGMGGWSQQAIRMYSSKLLALKAMRAEIEREYANDLAVIDEVIEKEQANDRL